MADAESISRQGKCDRVLLTGATGYIGSGLLPLLERRGVAVRCPCTQARKFAAAGGRGDRDRPRRRAGSSLTGQCTGRSANGLLPRRPDGLFCRL